MTTSAPPNLESPFAGYQRADRALAPARDSAVRGAADHMVIQRDEAFGSLTLTSPAEARIEAVDDSGSVVAEARGATLQLRLPVGGPYRVEEIAEGRRLLVAEDILVGDLWVLAGQSNMQGLGWLDEATADTPDPRVHMLDEARRWRLAEEPLHSPAHSPDRAHWGSVAAAADLDAVRSQVPVVGAGLGLSFAKALVAAHGVPVGLVPTALGGTSIYQWDPDGDSDPDVSLYASMRSAVVAAGGRIRGVLWYQGEAEASHPELSGTYESRLRSLISGVRRDCGSQTAFFHVQVGRLTHVHGAAADAAWSRVRMAQASPAVGSDGFAAALDLELDDPVHIGAQALSRLGRRLARLVTGQAETIRVGAVTASGRLGAAPFDGIHLRLDIRLSGLTGALPPMRHVPGFSVRTEGGAEVPILFRAEVTHAQPATISVRLAGPVPDEFQGQELSLWYGYGPNPFCQLVDEADNAVPAFGPLRLDLSS